MIRWTKLINQLKNHLKIKDPLANRENPKEETTMLKPVPLQRSEGERRKMKMLRRKRPLQREVERARLIKKEMRMLNKNKKTLVSRKFQYKRSHKLHPHKESFSPNLPRKMLKLKTYLPSNKNNKMIKKMSSTKAHQSMFNPSKESRKIKSLPIKK